MPPSAAAVPKLPGINATSHRGMVNDMIKRRLLMVVAALAVGTVAAGAQGRLSQPAPGAHVMPAQEIITILRSTGFDPVSRPVRVGSRYKIRAFDPDDFEVNLLVDGRTGRILTVRDNDDDWPMAPPNPYRGFRQAAGRFGPLSYGRPIYPGGLMPPRGIPARRSGAAVEPQKAPVPRSRPAHHGPAVASTAPGAPGAPAAPGKKQGTSAVPKPAGTPIASAPPIGGTTPGAANAGIKGSVGALSGKDAKTARTATNPAPSPKPAAPENTLASSGPPAPDAASPAKSGDTLKIVPVAPLE